MYFASVAAAEKVGVRICKEGGGGGAVLESLPHVVGAGGSIYLPICGFITTAGLNELYYMEQQYVNTGAAPTGPSWGKGINLLTNDAIMLLRITKVL